MIELKLIGLYFLIMLIQMSVLHKWPKFFGVDKYDESNNYVNQDDYNSKSEAIAVFSVFWPIIWVVLIVAGMIQILMIISKYIENTLN